MNNEIDSLYIKACGNDNVHNDATFAPAIVSICRTHSVGKGFPTARREIPTFAQLSGIMISPIPP
jgi:hypothetical protein